MRRALWRKLQDERTIRLGVLGVRLVDSFTGMEPIGTVRSILEIKEPGGTWKEADVKPTLTSTGVIAYSLRALASDLTKIHPGTFPSLNNGDFPSAGEVRVRIEADLYLPGYLPRAEGLEPPLKKISTVFLHPAANYPFSGSARIARGVVTDAADQPVLQAEIVATHPPGSAVPVEQIKAVSDPKGEFALPITRTAAVESIRIEATDVKNNRAAFVDLTIEAALNQVTVIKIN